MKRVMIIGQPGSGKSTLAQKLGEITQLPVFHFDAIHWKPGWVSRADDEKATLAAQIHAQDKWIFEGNNPATDAARISRADTYIWLDLPLALRLWRVLTRTLRYRGRTRPDMPDNCPEHFNWAFTIWIFTTYRSARIKPLALVNTPPSHLSVHHLRSQRAIDHYLATLTPNSPVPETLPASSKTSG